MSESGVSSAWSPQPGPQTEAIAADWCPELLYGGAAGGGKSDFLLGDFLQDVPTYGPAWRGVLFRRTYPELQELMTRAAELFPQTGATWYESDKEWHWPNGAFLRLRYLERDPDATRYQGHQYTWIGWDELTQWPTLYAYRYLRARLRSAFNVPTKRIRATANPGGLGHMAVKEYFIDPWPAGYRPIRDDKTGLERMFIPSRIQDNRILLANDPEYIARLKGLGSDALVKAWLDGDWSVVDGAFFDCWSTARHVVEPFEIPADWTRFRSLDWGYAAPFSVQWWAIAGDTIKTASGAVIPRGALVHYREWYGCTEPNKGLRLDAEAVADGIRQRDGSDKIAYAVADPSIFAQDGGPSIAERMNGRKVAFAPADNKRVAQAGALGGWDQMRARMRGDEHPMLFVFSTCKHFIRTVPALQHDPDRPEDLDTEGEDHAADAARYACMSRPYVRDKKQDRPTTPAFAFDEKVGLIKSNMTISELIERQSARRRQYED